MLRLFLKTKKKKQRLPDAADSRSAEDLSINLFLELEKNIENIRRVLDSPSDLVTRYFSMGTSGVECAVAYIDGLVNQDILEEKVIQSVQAYNNASPGIKIEQIERQALSASVTKRVKKLDEVILSILSGGTAFFLEGSGEVLMIESKGGANRSVEEPITESVIRGPRDGFTENIRVNTALVRRRIKDPNLRLKSMVVGRRSRTDVIIAFVDGLTDPNLPKEVERRIASIDTDNVEESGVIEQYIEENHMSFFPQYQSSERPDRIAAALLQGMVAIFVDGTPFVLYAPVTLNHFLMAPEDYYERWQIGSLLRLLRYIAAFIAFFFPALYIALNEYHQGMIPSKLAFSIAASREGVPFPAVIEAMLMEFTMEILREAGLRLPKPIGQTIGIVGGLVIGEAAVSAGIVSPNMVIVVALTAISSFALPSYSFAISLRILRFLLMLVASILGLYGVILTYIAVNIHLVNLENFGVPFTTPYAPLFPKDLKDAFVRFPTITQTDRPEMLHSEDPKRTKEEWQR